MKTFNTVARMAAVVVLVAVAGLAAAQQPYPNKPIRFIVGNAPGGSTDIMARLFGKKLAESWGQQVVVENRTGGGTIIAVDTLAKAPPDGYTIMLSGGNLVLTPLLFPAPYDPIKDVAPVAVLARSENVLVISPSVPANNLRELVAYAKSKPGQLNYATPGAGTTQHLGLELLNLAAQIKTQHIPYKGAGSALTDLLGGQVQLCFLTNVVAIPHVNSGKLKAMAITGGSRSPLLPQVPTFAQAGLSGLEAAGTWFGVIAPAGTPKLIIDKISTELGKYMAMTDFTEKLISQGLNPSYATPGEFAALLKADLARYSRIIKTANIKMNN